MTRLTWFVILAMVTGVVTGFVLHETVTDPAQIETVAGWFSIATDIFLRLIKMIIGPLVMSTLVVGIAHMEDTAAIGRVGAKTMGWFVIASLVSLTIGLVMVNLIQPGVGLGLNLPEVADGAIGVGGLSFKDFVVHLVPSSIFKALADNEILQIVVFSIFVGTAIAALDDHAPVLLKAAEQLASVMLKITGYVMALAPVAIFAALASTVATQGLGVLLTYAKFLGGFYLSLGLLWALLIVVAFVVIGRHVRGLLNVIREPTLLAFSTASSEAAYPRILAGLQSFGVRRQIVSFVLPLGYSFNLDGSMMYCTFAVIFIAQAYGIDLTLGQEITMLLLLMVTSKGMAGVPRASLVVIAATLTYFKLPEAGLLLILAVDHVLDMGRSATNVIGNAVAATVIAKWENKFEPGQPEEEDTAA
ncbi:dicarboxylate/amino acid:cation symporter [Alphaproteobacteria bacterium LMG 31809]|uniref:Dicarboxylate/amino acid:cation symporter n=2 Tax=Govanella unica TaxID=2975056 RepID=A0A9X3Z6S9_9PROT|nr:dicarboxylate/amino acid:cation symporter [Govania unica]MDA5193249.1 dicarboxylate/amino acid:cation symporter [Govania unica]